MQDYLTLNRSPVCFCWYYMMAMLTHVSVSNRNFKTILFAFRWKSSLAATLPIAPMKSSFCAACILSSAICHAVLFLYPLLSAAFGIHGSSPQVSFYNRFSVTPKLSRFLPRIHTTSMGRKPGIKVGSTLHASASITQFKCSLNFPNVALNLRSVTWIFHFCFHNLHLKYIIHMLGGGVLRNAVLLKCALCRVTGSLHGPS